MRKAIRHGVMPLLVTLAILTAREFLNARVLTPVYADAGQYVNLQVNHDLTVDDSQGQGSSIYTANYSVHKASSNDDCYTSGVISAEDYEQGATTTCGPPNEDPKGLIDGSSSGMKIESAGFVQYLGDTGAMGAGDLPYPGYSYSGAHIVAKDPNDNDNVRAVVQAAKQSDYVGTIFVGTMMKTPANADKPGPAITITSAGNVIFALPSSGTVATQSELNNANANGLGIQYPKPDMPTTAK